MLRTGDILGEERSTNPVWLPCSTTTAERYARRHPARSKDGLATARKHGRTPSRPPLQPETILVLQDLAEAGKSVSQAAKHLGIGRSTAYKVIRNADQ